MLATLTVCIFLLVSRFGYGYTHSTIVCEGQILNLGCRAGELIHVKSVNYGRTLPGSALCPLNGHDSNANCLSSNSINIVMNMCHKKQKCSVPATNQVFGDPCHLTYKYLEVEHACIKYNQVACENGQLSLSCRSGELIDIKTANYGRTLAGSVLCPMNNRDRHTQCFSPNSLNVVRHKCHKKQQCTIPATNGVFGDPCVGTYKYLEVEYVCTKYSQIACESKTLTLSCSKGEEIEVLSANYGRTLPGSVCPMNGIDKLTNCRSLKSIEIVKEMCERKQVCSIAAINTVFGDPCVGTYKYLDVNYNCIPVSDRFKDRVIIECETGSKIKVIVGDNFKFGTESDTCNLPDIIPVPE